MNWNKFKWKNIKIRYKLYISFGVVIVLLLQAILLGITSIRKLENIRKEEQVAVDLEDTFHEKFIDHLTFNNAIAKELLKTGTNKLSVQENYHKCSFGKWFYDNSGEQEVLQYVPNIKDELNRLEAIHIELHKTVTEMNGQLANSQNNQAIQIFSEQTQKQIANMGIAINTIHEEISKKSEAHLIENEKEIAIIKRTITIITILALVLAVILIWLITHSLNYGISKAVSLAEKMAQGNLQERTDTKLLLRNDEIGTLSKSFHQVTEKLHEVVSEIMNGSLSIMHSSQNVSTSSEVISESANNHASSSEELAASFEEINAMITQSTSNAVETGKKAELMLDKFHESIEATDASVQMMEKITAKIKIINELAFQTNLLSLNASIEAARVKEHGHGFAVVAEEVRKLADRSKEAANEIMAITTEGSALAKITKQKMDETIPLIEQTAVLVQEIAHAGMEQTTGVEQVNIVMQQLNSTSQENASVSEELAASAEELSSLAQHTNGIISFFKLDRD